MRQRAKKAEQIILESDEIVSAKIGLDMDLFTLLEERRKEARDQQDILANLTKRLCPR